MLKTDKAALLAALSAAGSIVKAKDKIPVLQNILIEPSDDAGHLMARGGNIDMEIAARFPAAIADTFRAFTCPAQSFIEFVRNAPDNTILIEPVINDGGFTHVTLRAAKSRLKLPVLPADAFPKLPTGELVHGVTLAAETLKDALNAVRYAASTDVSQYYLCGVLFDGTPDGLNLLATDTKRLERRLIPAIAFDPDKLPSSLPRVIIGSTEVDRIIKLCDMAEDVTVEVSDIKIRVTSGDVVMIGKLVDGAYPDWNRITGFTHDIRAGVDVGPLKDAIGRVLIATPDSGNGVTFKFADDTLTMVARDMASGEGEDTIGVEIDHAIVIGLNGKHVREALDHMANNRAELLMSAADKPAMLRAVGETVNFTVLMPMQPKGGYA